LKYLFIGLAVANTLLFLLTAIAGFWPGIGSQLHMLIGLFTTLFTCLLHSIVFVYFLGTGWSIKYACEEKGISETFYKDTIRLRPRHYPFAVLGPIMMIITAMTGGAFAAASLGHLAVHRTLALIAILVNIFCFVKEHEVITENMAIIGRLARVLPPEHAGSIQ